MLWGLDQRNENCPKIGAGIRVNVNVAMLIQRIIQNPYLPAIDSDIERLLATHNIEVRESAVHAKRRE